LKISIFAGDERCQVTANIDERKKQKMKQFTGYDPFILRTNDRRVNRDNWNPGAAKCMHLFRFTNTVNTLFLPIIAIQPTPLFTILRSKAILRFMVKKS